MIFFFQFNPVNFKAKNCSGLVAGEGAPVHCFQDLCRVWRSSCIDRISFVCCSVTSLICYAVLLYLAWNGWWHMHSYPEPFSDLCGFAFGRGNHHQQTLTDLYVFCKFESTISLAYCTNSSARGCRMLDVLSLDLMLTSSGECHVIHYAGASHPKFLFYFVQVSAYLAYWGVIFLKKND